MVLGLTRFVAVDSSPFVFERPHSPYIIVQPVEFFVKTLKKYTPSSHGAYGVDLLRARCALESAIRDLLNYQLKPIFIFNGISYGDTLRLKCVAAYNLKSAKFYKKADLDVSGAKYRLTNDYLPFARALIGDCLQEMNVPFVQVCHGCMSSSLGVAYILDCPIASMSSSYFLVPLPRAFPTEVESITVNDLKFVYLDGDGSDFFCIDESESSSALKLKIYHPELSLLKVVPATSRPLIALLMDVQLFPKLPEAIKIEQLDSESFTSARLRTVIEWVSKTNPIYVLKAIMEAVTNPALLDYISSRVLAFLATFCPNFWEASEILSLLKLARGFPLVKPKRREVRPDTQVEKSSSPEVFFEKATALLKGLSPEENAVDFLDGWPTALVHLYRYKMLEKDLVTAIYEKSGCIADSANYYLIEFPNIYGASMVFRFLIYCLLSGVEETNGRGYKLVGLRPFAREVCYEGNFCYKSYAIHVKPMYLPPKCSADDFIHAFFGLNDTSTIPDWSFALGLSCILWHQQKTKHNGCDISECPLILSTVVIAVATYYNRELDMSTLVDHYDALKSKALAKAEEAGAPLTADVEKELMHSGLELVSVYDHCLSLYYLLTALQEPNQIPVFSSQAYHRFPKIHHILPSFELLVYITSHLRSQKTPSAVALRLWLTNVFLPDLNTSASVLRLHEAISTFSTLHKFISTVKLCYKAPTVDVTDPPPYFLPRGERTSAESRLNSQARRGHVTSSINASPSADDRKWGKKTASGTRSQGANYARKLAERVEKMTISPTSNL